MRKRNEREDADGAKKEYGGDNRTAAATTATTTSTSTAAVGRSSSEAAVPMLSSSRKASDAKVSIQSLERSNILTSWDDENDEETNEEHGSKCSSDGWGSGHQINSKNAEGKNFADYREEDGGGSGGGGGGVKQSSRSQLPPSGRRGSKTGPAISTEPVKRDWKSSSGTIFDSPTSPASPSSEGSSASSSGKNSWDDDEVIEGGEGGATRGSKPRGRQQTSAQTTHDRNSGTATSTAVGASGAGRDRQDNDASELMNIGFVGAEYLSMLAGVLYDTLGLKLLSDSCYFIQQIGYY